VGSTASPVVERSSLLGGAVNFVLLHCSIPCFSPHFARIKGCILRLEPRSELCSTSRVPSKLQYCVYVLLSLHDSDLYVGFTTDLQRRLTEHFHGESKATAPRRPFRLIFPVRHSPEQCRRGDGGCEYFFSKKDAERREMYLKTTAGRKGLKLILRETLQSHVWD